MTNPARLLHCAVLFLSSSLWGATAAAVEVKIESLAGSSCEGPAVLELRCAGEGCESSAPITRQVTVPATVTLPLVTAMRARLTRNECWAPDVLLRLDRTDATMPLWRAGTIAGTFGAPPAEGPAITALEIAIQLPKNARTRDFEDDVLTGACTIDQRKWQCAVPATAFDARVLAAGYTPWYFWGLEPKPAAVLPAGEQRLDTGASVIGWVKAAGSASPTDVHLRVRTYDTPDGPRRDFGLTAMTVRANDRGFFQFRNVPLGAYAVTAASGTAATVEPVPIDVDHATEHKLRTSVDLVPPVPLEVRILPATGSDGQPWTVVLERALPGSSSLEPFAESAAAPDGSWTRTIPVGTYMLSIVDATGSKHHRRALTVDGTVDSIAVDLQRIRIEGTVTAGGEPLNATLTFRSRRGATMTLQSDDKGAFAGALPEEGAWSVRVRPVSAAMYYAGVPVEVKRTGDGSPVVVDIDLPVGRLRGTVTDRLGKGVEADVQVWQDTRLLVAAASDAAGKFEIVGLPLEEVAVRAVADAGQSPLLRTTVREENISAVDLVIAKDNRVRGHVQTRSGRAASGALIRYTSPLFLEQRETTAGASGEFTLSLPASVPYVDLVIMAAGVPSTILRIESPRRDDFLQIALEEESAVLKVLLGGTPSWPYVGRQGALVALPALFPPRVAGPPPGLSRDGFETNVAPGLYHLCPTAALNDACQQVLLAPYAHTVVDFSKPAP